MQVDTLSEVSRRLREQFETNREILSFSEWFDLFRDQPARQGRSIAQYLMNVFDHFGTTTINGPRGEARRFNLFDTPFDGGNDRLVGQESVQNAVYRLLQNFVRTGRVNQLILLHGPNGSAKSTFISCVGRALQAYSQAEEGALYRFNWVFPSDRVAKKGIGFADRVGDGPSRSGSYAHLPDEDIDARIRCELSDPPIFLIPRAERAKLLAEMEVPEGHQWADYILQGQLSQKSRKIYDALLKAYHGDYERVLRHVQVERFYVNHRYRSAFVTVEPQMRVDAQLRQVTMDRSLEALPPALRHLSLFEPMGDLVDANRGMLEFNDLLKRPLEAFKYILSTCEKSTVSLDHAILFLDCVFIGSANEKHLNAFKEVPDFNAFKGRIELVRVPYLLDYEAETGIYDEQVRTSVVGKPVAPHTTALAALWAVLTRLKKPQADRYPKAIREIMSKLTPLEKAELYTHGEPPSNLAPEVARELRANVAALSTESDAYVVYEGLLGASPREIKTLLLNAAQNAEFPCLSPLALIRELTSLVEDKSVHQFLQMEPVGDYMRPGVFIEVVRQRYLDLVEHEVRDATGLVDETSYVQLLDKYVIHVKHFVQGEKMLNPITGKYVNADEDFMSQVESKLAIVGKPTEFRHNFFNRIGAWGHENPGDKFELGSLFAKELDQLRESYYVAQRKNLKAIFETIMDLDDSNAKTPQADLKTAAEQTLSVLEGRYGYHHDAAREAVAFLLTERYSD